MALKYGKRVANQSHGLGGECRILCGQEIREALEIR
jgi:hypothetical protein